MNRFIRPFNPATHLSALLTIFAAFNAAVAAPEMEGSAFVLAPHLPDVLIGSGGMRLAQATTTDRLTRRVAPTSTPTPQAEETEATVTTIEATPAPAAEITTATTTIPSAPAPANSISKDPDGIRLNFQGAALSDVLNYLSEAAGFVIVQEAPVTGTVNVVSRQSLSPEEAVDLVNAVLAEKGYVAIRTGRILKIVSRRDAQKRDLPVQTGSDPEKIPRKDEVVTQILPLRYTEAAKLVENLRPLLAETANLSANESSNTILLTDTQTNIRRIAQIIRAIDTSLSSISSIRVYPLQFADAKELATVITQLFAAGQVNPSGGGGNVPGGGRGDRGRDRWGPPQAAAATASQNDVRAAASRVIAVADEQSNSIIVSAPEEMLSTITDIITRVDTNIAEVTDTRIFRLLHADAPETADILNNLYSQTSTQPGQTGQRGGNQGAGGPGLGWPGFGGGPGGPGQVAGQGRTQTQSSQRALLQARVVAVGDPRTNSLLVNAARETMTEVAELIGRLDATDAKRQRVYVHSLEHADADSVATVLRGMLGGVNGSSTQAQTNRLLDRTATGATIDSADSGTGSGGRATR